MKGEESCLMDRIAAGSTTAKKRKPDEKSSWERTRRMLPPLFSTTRRSRRRPGELGSSSFTSESRVASVVVGLQKFDYFQAFNGRRSVIVLTGRRSSHWSQQQTKNHHKLSMHIVSTTLPITSSSLCITTSSYDDGVAEI